MQNYAHIEVERMVHVGKISPSGAKNVFFWGSGICRFYLVALDMSLIDRIVILAETSLQAMWPCV
jgi:hypothetical protein